MNKQQQQVKARKAWLKIYLESRSVTKPALRCGIARSTLHRWTKRYKEEREQDCQISQDVLPPLPILRLQKKLNLLFLI